MKKHIFMVAGEASGDLHGAHLINALKEELPNIEILGIGGPRMRAAGLKPIYEAEKMSVVGIVEVFSHLKHIYLAWQRAKRAFLNQLIDLFVPIDYPDFNLRLALWAQKENIPVFYYISPQIWAWRKNRIKKIASVVNEMAVILPFEEAIYRHYNVKVVFVGHPLLDIIPVDEVQDEPLIGLLPGSRIGEIKYNLPIMLESASLIYQRRPELKFILPLAPTLKKRFIREIIKHFPSLPLDVVEDKDYFWRKRCCFLIVASGTATLETAILLKPFIIVYRLSPLTYILGKRLVKVPYIGLVNWVAGKKIVPEFIQQHAKPQLIAQTVLDFLNHEEKIQAMRIQLKEIRSRLGNPGVAKRVAKRIKSLLT
ncbi:MAG TPA: lipid-A-disaccharide synthase [Candidatus Desulfofervidus auxilii]|uniref:Lipid-A-disaccharide synthase n=1 Tax=Desulfofervidus auxilii TaxID=1621989 RepID=A0A7V0I9Z6_DESA2|nr:lipid-A-disaccharide synthase [Candidatus Desulfofervidus auxilii]